MNIAPIYELKSRLRASAIAGTNLLSEDFRLKKVVEGFAPLEKASPVFAKIGEMTRNLLADNSPANLLDTITLVDSVITTLGTVEVKSEIEDIETFGGGEMIDMPYSRISAVVNALTTKGSGNYNTFKEISENSPELLRDYRVRPALAAGLGASYGELAELVLKYVENSDSSMIPLLKKGFDPKGKKDMVRRVQAIEILGGASENAFYLKQLEDSEKDVRKALIYALRHDTRNAEKLIELSKTEKGKLKEAALAALIGLDCEESAAFFEEYSKKKPVDVLKLLFYASSEWSSKLAARLIEQTSVDEKGNKVSLEQIAVKNPINFDVYIEALNGKFGSEIEQIYRGYNSNKRIRALDRQLGDAIIMTDNAGLKSLASELNNAPATKGRFVYAEAVTRLLSDKDCSEWVEEQVKRVYTSILKESKAKSKSKSAPKKPSKDADELDVLQYLIDAEEWENEYFDSHAIYTSPIIEALNSIVFTGKDYRLQIISHNDITDRRVCYMSKPLSQPIKGAISDTLIKYPTCELSSILAEWIDLDDKEFCNKLENHFIEQGTTKSHTGGRGVLLNLRKLNVQNVKGLAMKYLKNHPNDDKWDVRGLFNCIFSIALNNSDCIAQAKEVYEAMRSGKLKTKLTKEEIEDFWSWAEKEFG